MVAALVLPMVLFEVVATPMLLVGASMLLTADAVMLLLPSLAVIALLSAESVLTPLLTLTELAPEVRVTALVLPTLPMVVALDAAVLLMFVVPV